MAILCSLPNLHSSIIPSDFNIAAQKDFSALAIDAEDQNSDMEFTQELSPTIQTDVDHDVDLSNPAEPQEIRRGLIHDSNDALEDFEPPNLPAITDNHSNWLQECRNQQVELYGQMHHPQDQMGIWELDLLHNRHECYNAFLFTRLRPSSPREQDSPAKIFGYGSVMLKVLYDKASNSWQHLTLHDVRYVRAAPQDNNHRLGLSALPFETNLHLPEARVHGGQGDGFLSVDNGIGCALGRINQGGRKIWTLRTYDLDQVSRSTAAATRQGFFGAWFMGSGSKNRSGKRQLEEDMTEPESKRVK